MTENGMIEGVHIYCIVVAVFLIAIEGWKIQL